MVSKIIAILNLTLLYLLIGINPSLATQKLSCATTHYPPYTSFDESKREFYGLDMRIINPLFKSLRLDIEIVNLPWARLKTEMSKSNYDCYFLLGKLEDREEYLNYVSTPMHVTKIAIFYPEGEDNKKLNFSRKIVGVHRGINFHEDILDLYNLKFSKIYKLPSNEIMFSLLNLGKVDVVVTGKVVGEDILKNRFPKFGVTVTEVVGYELPTYLAFRKGVIDIDVVNKELLGIIKTVTTK